MNDDRFTELLRREEAKRAKMQTPAEQWQATLDALNWAESQLPVPRNSKEACLAAQRRILDMMHGRGD
jgi:hypothetical protein